MQRQTGGIPAFVLVVIAVGVFGVLVFMNTRSAPSLRVIIPTEGQPTEAGNAWEQILQQGFGSDSTPLPTAAIPTANFIPPTLSANGEVTPVSPADLGSNAGAVTLQFSVAASPTPPLATIAP